MKMPVERSGITRKFKLAYQHKDGTDDFMRFYFTANLGPDGKLAEVFVKADKPGSLASGALDALAIMISIALQNGVPLELIIGKLRRAQFKPNGFTKDTEFPSCSSPTDLLAQWLEKRFLPKPEEIKSDAGS